MASFSARPLIVLGAAVLLPRLFLAIALGVVGRPEWWEYDVVATNLAEGRGHTYDRLGFVYAAYAPPLWSWILAALIPLQGAARAGIQVAQALLCFGASVATATLTRRITGDHRTGMLAGLLVALQPSLLYYSVVKSDPLPLNVFLVSLIALAGASLVAKPGGVRAAGFGILVALSVLSRGTPVVALPLVFIGMFWRWGQAAILPGLVAMLAFTACLAPWIGRNIRVLGAPLITSTTGENFWRGNHEGASGGVLDLNGGDITRLEATNPALPEAIRAVLANGTELDRHKVFMAEAWRFIREEPLEALRLLARKLRTLWWRIDSDPRDYPRIASVAYEWIYRAELALALIGAAVALRVRGRGSAGPDRTAAGSALALAFSIGLLQCAFYAQGRHRFLIEPLMLAFTACGLATLAPRLISKGPAQSDP